MTLHVTKDFEGDVSVFIYDANTLSALVAEQDAKNEAKKKEIQIFRCGLGQTHPVTIVSLKNVLHYTALAPYAIPLTSQLFSCRHSFACNLTSMRRNRDWLIKSKETTPAVLKNTRFFEQADGKTPQHYILNISAIAVSFWLAASAFRVQLLPHPNLTAVTV